MKNHPELTGDRCPNCNGSGSVIATCGAFRVQVDCEDCAGTGLINSPNGCKECKGKGTIIVKAGFMNVESICEHCNGSGLEPLT